MHVARLVALATLAACQPYAQFDPSQARALSIAPASGPARLCANRPLPPLRATIATADGTARRTGPGGTLSPATVRWSTDHGTVGADGQLELPDDALATLGQPVVVHAAVVGRASVAATAVLQRDYACGVVVAADGDAGRDGRGNRTWPIGAPGEAGDNGGLLDVAVALVATPIGELALARVTFSDGGVRYYALDPHGPPMYVSARGGSGGAGGPGRYWRGADAPGGSGGAVRVRYDTAHPELRALVHALTDGGSGRGDAPDGEDGDPARYEPQPAAALFADELARGVPIVRS